MSESSGGAPRRGVGMFLLGMLLPSGCLILVVLVTRLSSLFEDLLFAARAVLVPLLIAVSLALCGLGVLDWTGPKKSKGLAIINMVAVWIVWQIFLVTATALICYTLLKKS